MRFSLVVVIASVLAFAVACGGTETVVATVIVERVVTQAPERIVETVEVEKVVEVEKIVEVEKVVEVEVTAAPSDDAMMMDDGVVPRERQFIMLWGGSGGVGSAGQYTNHDVWNVYSGVSHQDGPALIFEPLAFYSAFSDTEYPWLAESWEYSADFTELTINTRQNVNWSDGTPFGAHDVAYTIEHLRSTPGLPHSGQIQADVESVELIDDNTLLVKFLGPRPKFLYFMTYKFDIGVYIVPKHIYEGNDWLEFTNFDLAKGWPVTTGPWDVVQTSTQSKILNRRDSWWAVEQGLLDKMPEVLQIVYIPNPGRDPDGPRDDRQPRGRITFVANRDDARGSFPATTPLSRTLDITRHTATSTGGLSACCLMRASHRTTTNESVGQCRTTSTVSS